MNLCDYCIKKPCKKLGKIKQGSIIFACKKKDIISKKRLLQKIQQEEDAISIKNATNITLKNENDALIVLLENNTEKVAQHVINFIKAHEFIDLRTISYTLTDTPSGTRGIKIIINAIEGDPEKMTYECLEGEVDRLKKKIDEQAKKLTQLTAECCKLESKMLPDIENIGLAAVDMSICSVREFLSENAPATKFFKDLPNKPTPEAKSVIKIYYWKYKTHCDVNNMLPRKISDFKQIALSINYG